MTDPTVDALAPEQFADLIHESRCGPVLWRGNEHVPWSDDHREWDIATAKALLLLVAKAGAVLVTEASLAEALALAEVGCWANPPIHGPEQDAEVHGRDAAAVMGRLKLEAE